LISDPLCCLVLQVPGLRVWVLRVPGLRVPGLRVPVPVLE
jgi:hypothetical protein